MFLNLFLFYQVVRPLGRKSVNKYVYVHVIYYRVPLFEPKGAPIKSLLQ